MTDEARVISIRKDESQRLPALPRAVRLRIVSRQLDAPELALFHFLRGVAGGRPRFIAKIADLLPRLRHCGRDRFERLAQNLVQAALLSMNPLGSNGLTIWAPSEVDMEAPVLRAGQRFYIPGPRQGRAATAKGDGRSRSRKTAAR